MQIKPQKWNTSEIKTELSSHGIQWNAYGERLFTHPSFPLQANEEAIHVVSRTLRQLGFLSGATRGAVEQCLPEHQLLPVPLQYVLSVAVHWPKDLPTPITTKGEHPPGAQLIFSPHLEEEDDFPKGFYLINRPDGYWIRAYIAPLDYVFPPEAEFLFINEAKAC